MSYTKLSSPFMLKLVESTKYTPIMARYAPLICSFTCRGNTNCAMKLFDSKVPKFGVDPTTQKDTVNLYSGLAMTFKLISAHEHL
jgi:hypothetical protein